MDNCSGLCALVEKEDNSVTNPAIKRQDDKVLRCLVKICNILFMFMVLYSNTSIYISVIFSIFLCSINKILLKYCRQS